ncbi:hypothetical protein [Luedemannella helvata]|uniref:hypothetical protein n=1 Tax=Luedemannella helvata TaxID=349315 RepID=UPI0031D9A85D
MAIAALVISIVSGLIALGSAYYTRVQARAATDQVTAALDQVALMKAQIHDQRTPRFAGVVEDLGSWHRLALRLLTPGALQSIRVTILGGGAVQFTPSQNGVDPGGAHPLQVATWSAAHPQQKRLLAGDRAMWRVAFNGDPPKLVHLRVECVGDDGDVWNLTTEVRVEG